MGRFELRPFAVPEAEMIAHWAPTAEDVWHVAGLEQTEMTASLVTAWTMETNFAFTLRRDGDLVAYGEILEDEVEGDVEIQHLLVAPDMRRQGIGKALLSRLAAFVAASRPYPEVWMRVRRDNEPAARCARAVGFEDDGAMSGPALPLAQKTAPSRNTPMILSDRSIKDGVAQGRITITPYDETMVQPASYDIRLDTRFRVFRNYKYSFIDPRMPQDELTELLTVAEGEKFFIHPGEFLLGNTVERIALGNDLVGRVEGKALALGTEVPTPDGWTTMGQLKPGDQVFGGNGEPCKVIAVSPIYLGNDCYTLVFDDKTTVVADAAHRWMTWTRAERARQIKFNKRVADGMNVRVLPTPSIKTTAQIAATVRHETPGSSECNHAVDVACLDAPEASLPIDPYVLGTWLGDGTSTEATLTVGQEDQAHFEREFLKRGYPLGPRSVPTLFSIGNVGHTRNAKGQYCDNGSFKCRLRSLGVLANKHIPMAYLRASFCQRLELLKGLMDTDGTCSHRGRPNFVAAISVWQRMLWN